MLESIPYIGEIFALTTAFIWASAVILFKKSGETVHPLALNLFKNGMAFVMYPLTLAIVGKSILHQASSYDFWMLMLSGALGMAVADTFFFKSLNILGASRSAIVDCMYSPFMILFSVMILGERLALIQIIGVLLIISAVLAVGKEEGEVALPRRDLLFGILWGTIAMSVMAVGIVIVKPILEKSPLFWAMEVRLLGAILALILMIGVRKDRRKVTMSMFQKKGWVYMVGGSFMGTYLALIFWLGGMKYTLASTASALNQTSNIIVFIFAAIFLKEVITKQKMVGILLGVTGVFLVTLGL